MTHPTAGLDDVIHQRVRLGILAVLHQAKRADFARLRETLELTDGNLSQHLRVLEEAGCVHITKKFEAGKPRTWVSATARGRAAFLSELSALRRLLVDMDLD